MALAGTGTSQVLASPLEPLPQWLAMVGQGLPLQVIKVVKGATHLSMARLVMEGVAEHLGAVGLALVVALVAVVLAYSLHLLALVAATMVVTLP